MPPAKCPKREPAKETPSTTVHAAHDKAFRAAARARCTEARNKNKWDTIKALLTIDPHCARASNRALCTEALDWCERMWAEGIAKPDVHPSHTIAHSGAYRFLRWRASQNDLDISKTARLSLGPLATRCTPLKILLQDAGHPVPDDDALRPMDVPPYAQNDPYWQRVHTACTRVRHLGLEPSQHTCDTALKVCHNAWIHACKTTPAPGADATGSGTHPTLSVQRLHAAKVLAWCATHQKLRLSDACVRAAAPFIRECEFALRTLLTGQVDVGEPAVALVRDFPEMGPVDESSAGYPDTVKHLITHNVQLGPRTIEHLIRYYDISTAYSPEYGTPDDKIPDATLELLPFLLRQRGLSLERLRALARSTDFVREEMITADIVDAFLERGVSPKDLGLLPTIALVLNRPELFGEHIDPQLHVLKAGIIQDDTKWEHGPHLHHLKETYPGCPYWLCHGEDAWGVHRTTRDGHINREILLDEGIAFMMAGARGHAHAIARALESGLNPSEEKHLFHGCVLFDETYVKTVAIPRMHTVSLHSIVEGLRAHMKEAPEECTRVIARFVGLGMKWTRSCAMLCAAEGAPDVIHGLIRCGIVTKLTDIVPDEKFFDAAIDGYYPDTFAGLHKILQASPWSRDFMQHKMYPKYLDAMYMEAAREKLEMALVAAKQSPPPLPPINCP